MSLLPPSFPLPPTSLIHHASYPTRGVGCCCCCCCCSLQEEGWTALMLGAYYGHTETVHALLKVDDINVNHANVSTYPLTPSPVVVGGGRGSFIISLFSTHTYYDALSPPNLKICLTYLLFMSPTSFFDLIYVSSFPPLYVPPFLTLSHPLSISHPLCIISYFMCLIFPTGVWWQCINTYSR